LSTDISGFKMGGMNAEANPGKRIAMVITELEPGGAERQLVDLAAGLRQLGHRPLVYSLAGPPSISDELPVALATHQISIEYLHARRTGDFRRVVQSLRRRLDAWQPDVIQSFLFHANVVAALAAPRDVSVVASVRVGREPAWRWWLLRWCAAKIAMFVCVSTAVEKTVQRRLGVSSAKTCVIPNGVHLSKYPAPPADLSRFGIAPGRRAILFAGRLERQKGIDRLMHAAPELLDRLPNHDLLVVGDGPLRRQLERNVKRPPLSRRVVLAGYQTDLPAIISACDLVVIPSRWEGMSNVMMEAMASGKPVIATAVEGTRDLLADDRNPQLVLRFSPGELATAVIRIVGDSGLSQSLGNKNRSIVNQKFSKSVMINGFDSVYGRFPPR